MRRLIVFGITIGILFCGFILFQFYRTPFSDWVYSSSFISPLSKNSLISLIPTPIIPTLTLDTVFSSDHTWVANLPDDKKITLVATGDVIPARSVNYKTIQAKDFTWAWKNIAPILRSGDLTLINLESPLVSNCPVTVNGMVFCADQRHIEGLLFSGVDVVNFANNHMGNYGEKGIEQTKQVMEKNQILVSGLGIAATKEVKGVTFAFLGFDDIGPRVLPIADMDREEIKKEISEAKKLADIVVVSMSWGVEYTDKPSDRQKELAHLAVDSGADLVIGNHPHWIEPLEFYNGKVIMYAHGNTIFDQMWSEETKKGVIGKYTFYDKKLVDIEFIPTYIKDYGQPTLLEGEMRQSVLEKLKNGSL